MEFLIPLNIATSRQLIVAKEHTAKLLGSGNVEVLATPMMIALMEAAALECVQEYLPKGWTTVGIKVEVEHMRATPVGERVSAEATLMRRENNLLDFVVEARDNFGLIGQGFHQRYLIKTEDFLNNLKKT